MGEVIDQAAAFSWSVAKYAKAFEMDGKTVAKRITSAGLLPAGEVRGNPVYLLKDVQS